MVAGARNVIMVSESRAGSSREGEPEWEGRRRSVLPRPHVAAAAAVAVAAAVANTTGTRGAPSLSCSPS